MCCKQHGVLHVMVSAEECSHIPKGSIRLGEVTISVALRPAPDAAPRYEAGRAVFLSSVLMAIFLRLSPNVWHRDAAFRCLPYLVRGKMSDSPCHWL